MNGFVRRMASGPLGLVVIAAAVAGVLGASQAFAQQSADCARLQAAIASAPARRRQAPLPRPSASARSWRSTSAYARSIGCDNQKFLFFGSDPPPQCGEIKGQIARMQANLADLQARAGGGRGGSRRPLQRRVRQRAGAAGQHLRGPVRRRRAGEAAASIPTNSLRLTSSSRRSRNRSRTKRRARTFRPAPMRSACAPATAASSPSPIPAPAAARTASRRSAGPSARTPTCSSIRSRSAARSTRRCRPPASAMSNMPNALKFQQSFDSTCSCRRKGESWAQALAAAEAKYGHESRDILVTPEKSAEMSRPIIAKAAADPKAKPRKVQRQDDARHRLFAARRPQRRRSRRWRTAGLDANGADTALSAAAATVSREASGIAGGGAQSGTVYSETKARRSPKPAPTGSSGRCG